MSSLLRHLLFGTTASVAIAAPVFGADHIALTHDIDRATVNAVQAARARRGAQPAPATASTAKELIANSTRAYPASCFSDTLPATLSGLPATPSGVLFSAPVTLFATNGSGASGAETVTITIFRVPCSSSGNKLSYNTDGGPVSATLMRIQRQAQYDGDTTLVPTVPDVRIAQGSVAFDDANGQDYVRVAPDPNTVQSDVAIDATLVVDSTTFVLENYATASAGGFFDFNQAFNIRFDNHIQQSGITPQFFLNVAAYNPTQATYPGAFLPLPIDGYMTGAWYDSAHGGEGILSEVLDTGDGKTRLFVATWYTFDSTGLPFWLTASGGFNIGATSLQKIPVTYRTGGGFAGNFTAPIPQPAWGTMNVKFPDCQTMTFDYASTTTDVNAPQGSGTRTWKRIGNINSLNCE
jgi:hypothetical protein